MGALKKLGLIAGGGDLPKYVLAGAKEQGADVFTIILSDFAKAEDYPENSQAFRLGDFGKLMKRLTQENVDGVCFAGIVKRPDFKTLRPDLGGMKYLPGVIAAAAKGDDALLRHVSSIFEGKGMPLIAPQEFCDGLLAPLGPLGEYDIPDAHKNDAAQARTIAREIGRLDIGQGAVVANGLVLAVEAAEGTDAMLSRISSLPENIKGRESARAGVLAKIIKPTQDTRMDLPTIGVSTVRAASIAGLAGIVVEAEKAFIIDKAEVTRVADELGLFVVGLSPDG